MWHNCKRILCIRADNMGDVIMTTPALRALKESFDAHITLLTSSMAYRIVPHIPVIDEVIVTDLPWVKAGETLNAEGLQQLAAKLREGNFDAAVIFTVYSQSALPAALLTMLAGIPKRLAWCRENPYALLTDWAPDAEPYRFILHQVERDLKLVNSIGAFTKEKHLLVQADKEAMQSVQHKLEIAGIGRFSEYIIFHPGVSEAKRQYPAENWIETGKLLKAWNIPILVTGTEQECELAHIISSGIGTGAYNVAGLFTIGEFIALIRVAGLVISVNTATVHIAAATQTPVIVLYALTNPQHTPWEVPARAFYFSIKESVRSRNEVVSWVHDQLFGKTIELPLPDEVATAAKALWRKAIG